MKARTAIAAMGWLQDLHPRSGETAVSRHV
jgi:hypothetical protein